MADLLQPSDDTLSTAISIAALISAYVERDMKTAEGVRKHAALIGEVANTILSKIDNPRTYIAK